jgi:hypothetical protein
LKVLRARRGRGSAAAGDGYEAEHERTDASDPTA